MMDMKTVMMITMTTIRPTRNSLCQHKLWGIHRLYKLIIIYRFFKEMLLTQIMRNPDTL